MKINISDQSSKSLFFICIHFNDFFYFLTKSEVLLQAIELHRTKTKNKKQKQKRKKKTTFFNTWMN